MQVYRESTAALDTEEIDETPSGVRAVVEAAHSAGLLEETCGERGHPQSSLAECECLCGFTRYD